MNEYQRMIVGAEMRSLPENESEVSQRTNADKRKAVMTLLDDEEWSKWSDREMGRRVGVSNHLVAELRPPVVTGNSPSEHERTFTTKHGTVANADVQTSLHPVKMPVNQIQATTGCNLPPGYDHRQRHARNLCWLCCRRECFATNPAVGCLACGTGVPFGDR